MKSDKIAIHGSRINELDILFSKSKDWKKDQSKESAQAPGNAEIYHY
jgi:hypothetical protein